MCASKAESHTPSFLPQSPARYAFILNPRSGNGRAARQWSELEHEVRSRVSDYKVFQTEHPGHATELTRQALHEGFERVVSCGGDGTHFEVVNGFFEDLAPINSEASMAILAIGTACDLRKTYCVPKGRDALPFITADGVVPIDVGRVTATDEKGGKLVRHYNTAAHIGLGGVVGEHTNRRSKALGGFMTFLLGVITARIEYSPKEMMVEIDGESYSDKLMEVIVANGFYDGGGMHVAPRGVLDDGLFEVYTIGEMGPIASLLNIPRMYRGTQDAHPAVRYRRGKRVTVRSEERVVVSPDGEVAGVLPATLEIVPKAIRAVLGPNPRVGG